MFKLASRCVSFPDPISAYYSFVGNSETPQVSGCADEAKEKQMSRNLQARSLDRITSAFLSDGQRSGPDVWTEAGAAIETAHRTKLPVGWTRWSIILLLMIAIVSIRAW